LFRLRRSLLLLAEGRRISDVSDAVGFSSPAYFASCFRAQFNCTPSEYQVEPSRIQA
jgi:AraC-like DNA-binding protein